MAKRRNVGSADRVSEFVLNLPKDAIEAICAKYHVKELALFGSALRSDFRQDSDIDVLVEFESDTAIGLLAFIGMGQELSEILGREVDLVPKERLKRRICKPILESARVIYER